MSRDIRSFFQPKKAPAKTAKPLVIDDDDDDVIPESPNVQIKNKKKESKKKRCISDSDEEIFESKKKKTDHSVEPTKSSHTKSKSAEKPALKEVKAIDIFGSGPIKRTEPLVKKAKKNTETGIHSDEEFEKSLLEVDAEEIASAELKKEKSPVKVIKEDAPSSKHHKESTSKDKHKNRSKDKSPHKPNGDSRSQELKSKDHKHPDTKKKYKEHVSPKKERSESTSSVDKEKKEPHKEKSSNKEEKSSNHKEEKRENGESSKEKKRDFSEFVDSDVSIIEDHDEKHRAKKKKLEKSLNESALTDEDRHERRMQSAALYKSYLNRSGPKHLGAKELPEGAPNCLANCAFLLTGVLDSFERDDIADAISKYGGSVKSGISRKVTHVLAGEDAGPAKMAKAEELGIKIISEDDFIQMIEDSSSKKSLSNNLEIKKETKKEKSPSRKTPKKKSHGNKERSQERKDKDHKEKYRDHKDNKERDKRHKHEKSEVKVESKDHGKDKSVKEETSKSPLKIDHEKKPETATYSSTKQDINGLSSHQSKSMTKIPANSLMWVEKYKPQNIKQIIGQHGDSSNVKKLIHWLTKWYVNRKAKLPKPSPWAKNDDGGFYKAALLSGPPGVGKTTTVALVCKELGFDMVEFNASDTRNKTLIKEQIGELLTTTSLAAYSKGETGKQAVTKKHVLVMDEVDGMAGNEDRGGLQEMISLIKSTAVPIICMCNDRSSPKMRTLVNYCFDLRFNRPRVEQIKSAMMSVCCKEGVKIPQDALSQLIVAANQDVRQTLNLLSMWAIDPSLMDSDKLKKDAKAGYKDLKLGPWEAVRKVFSAEEHKTMSIHDKSDLFFYDYSLAPLFVQENYLQVSPHCPKKQLLDRIAEAADSISLGNLVDSRIRGNQAWNLLPVQAMYASVIPGHCMSGHVAGQINFPAWLGNNSKTNKMHRLCQEIHAHTRLSTSGSKSSIFLDYAPQLRDAIVTPLLKEKSEGIEKSLEVLEAYHLLREDLDSLVELSLWSGQRNPMILIDSKIKAAMTRTYNKKAMALPYAPGAVKKGRAQTDAGEEQEEDVENDVEEEDSDPENDALIKKKKVKEDKPASKEKPGTSKQKAGPSKDKPPSKKKK